MTHESKSVSVPALKFTQWLDQWDNFDYSSDRPNRKPNKSTFLFSMKASVLRIYSDVYKRERNLDNAEGIQRTRDDKRTRRIQEFIKYGYPYGDLRENQRTEEKKGLKKPGWLPTAIVINILKPDDGRKGRTMNHEHAASIIEDGGLYKIQLPSPASFEANSIRPFEVIDGQHRLWAFEEKLEGNYELPIVAFHGLDIAWQAYLFWSINVSPKKINPSHAFDLYPLLRNQIWLEQTDDLTVYREARAQEITEWLYKHPASAWKGRINMLGESGAGRVSQAAFVRSLTAAFFGTGRGRTGRRGLFQASIHDLDEPLMWTRSQQVAILLQLWCLIKKAVSDGGGGEWTRAFLDAQPDARDPFDDRNSLLNQDMGARAAHAVVNDVLYNAAFRWKLSDWSAEEFGEIDTSEEDISDALASLESQEFYSNFVLLADTLACFDWRSLDGPGVRDNEDLELRRRAYRGSGGYTLLTKDIFKHLSVVGEGDVAEIAAEIAVEDN